jgi:hypothetical protein
VARLGRRFPALFPLLASGEVSLTVAASLKPHLTDDNHELLLAAVCNKTVSQAREAVAALFPKPDVPTTVRWLPERRPPDALPLTPAPTPSLALPSPAPSTSALAPTSGSQSPAASPALSLRAPSPPPASARIEPLSAARHRVQFTADASLKAKLDQARDLMRHRNPGGDLAPVVERAIELLLEQLMKERFGATQSPRHRAVASDRISNATRRTVLARDGLQCTWVDDHGRRCAARAWLELDHREPRSRGGDARAGNVRLLCRNHNRLAAEQVYGRDFIERAIARERASSVARE